MADATRQYAGQENKHSDNTSYLRVAAARYFAECATRAMILLESGPVAHSVAYPALTAYSGSSSHQENIFQKNPSPHKPVWRENVPREIRLSRKRMVYGLLSWKSDPGSIRPRISK